MIAEVVGENGAVRSRESKQERGGQHILIGEARRSYSTNVHADYVTVHQKSVQCQEDWKDVAACFPWQATSLHLTPSHFFMFDYTNQLMRTVHILQLNNH